MAEKDGRQDPVSSDESFWYEHSALSKWLRYDTWTWQLGLPLICNIDMENSGRSDAWGGLMLSDPEEVEIFDISFALVALLSEDPVYQLPPIKEPNNSDLGDYVQRLAALKKELGRDNVEINSDDVLVRMSRRHRALIELRQAHDIFMTNPDHGATDTFKPAYFLIWAASKGIDIPWLDWAKEQNLVDLSDTVVSRADLGTVVNRSDVGTRERNTLLVVIAALCEECGIDPEQRAITKKVVGLTEKIGAPVSGDTIHKILKSLASAVDSRTKTN